MISSEFETRILPVLREISVQAEIIELFSHC